MMKIKQFWLILFLVLFTTGCANDAKVTANLQTWLGQSIDSVIDKWSYPTGQFKAPNGNTVYMFDSRQLRYTPQTTTAYYDRFGDSNFGHATFYTHGGGYETFGCVVYMEIDKEKIIVRTSFRGSCNANNYPPTDQIIMVSAATTTVQ